MPGLIRSENGGSAIEYALIAALISIAIINATQAVGGNLAVIFENVAAAL
jgi:pilus assembly protein Flp/PilA